MVRIRRRRGNRGQGRDQRLDRDLTTDRPGGARHPLVLLKLKQIRRGARGRRGPGHVPGAPNDLQGRGSARGLARLSADAVVLVLARRDRARKDAGGIRPAREEGEGIRVQGLLPLMRARPHVREEGSEERKRGLVPLRDTACQT
jgi:hypothetical protein